MSEVRIEEVGSVTPELMEAMERLIPQLAPEAPLPTAAHLERLLSSGNCRMLVARDAGGRVLGTLTLAWLPIPTGVRYWIEDVVVDRAARGRGVGEALVRDALALALALGAGAVNLTSNPSREAANRLYRRLGFILRETNSYRYTFAEGER